MKKLCGLVLAAMFIFGCAYVPVAPRVKYPPYQEKIETDSAMLVFPEAIVLYSKTISYNNRVSRDCDGQSRALLTLGKDLSRFERAMKLDCPRTKSAGSELRAFIVGARTDEPKNDFAKFTAVVEAGEPIKMMEATYFLLEHVAVQLESALRYEFAPHACPSADTIESDFKTSPNEGMVMLLAARLATGRLKDGSRYLKFDETVAAWTIVRHFLEFRAGCLKDVEVDEMFAEFSVLLARLQGATTERSGR